MQQKLSLPFDAYVIGIEKDNRNRIGEVTECADAQGGMDCLNIQAPFFATREELRENLRAKYRGQLRPTYVSHIARFDDSRAPCFLFNTYEEAAPCPLSAIPVTSATLAAQSWSALAALGADMDRRMTARPPTHVVIYTMGWNTVQLEALDNIRRLTEQLVAAAREAGDASFRPLILVVTWPSTGKPTIPGSDYGIKAKDGDEVGAIWENILINRELRRLKDQHKFKLVVVGHSFGARAASRAVFSAPLVTQRDEPAVDLLLGLQGAFSFQRFLSMGDTDAPEGREGAPYRDHARQAGLVALTSSLHDEAVTRAGHRKYFVGSSTVFEYTRGAAYGDSFAHVATRDDGRLEQSPSCDPKRVLMIDASNVVIGNEPGTGGGAHSMIYTQQMGRLSYQLIKACAS